MDGEIRFASRMGSMQMETASTASQPQDPNTLRNDADIFGTWIIDLLTFGTKWALISESARAAEVEQLIVFKGCRMAFHWDLCFFGARLGEAMGHDVIMNQLINMALAPDN